MKTLSVFLFVLASIGPGNANDICAPQLKSCSNLPQSSAKACSSIISKSKLRLTTCSKPKSTVIKTSTVQPSTTKTVTVTQTVSSIVVTNVQRTVVNTARSTAVSQTTLVETSTRAIQTTVIVPETATVTESLTVTTISTSSVPYQQETCAAVTPAARKRQSNYKALDIIPRDCSCLLTTTTTCGQATKTTTITKPTSTAYVTQFKLTTVVKYATKPTDVLQTTIDIISALSTDTSTTVVAITDVQSVTSVVATTTTTTTTTATAIQTVQADPCADPVLYTDRRLDYPGATWGMMRDSSSPKDCCQSCFRSGRTGCIFWRYQNFICEVYVIPNKNEAVSCVTESCRKGRPTLVSAAGDGATYGIGMCAAAGFSG